MGLSLSPSQLNATVITERVTSIFSLLGILFILLTFLLGRGFDKPINRLIFFASWSNLGTSIAFLISQDGIDAGPNSPLCQFQAWALQFFLGLDMFWALCMAFNVYLALFRKWTAPRMQAQEWKYFIGCYGASFIPATVYLFLKNKERGHVYGDALLWCWVTDEWDFLRIATFYGIIWIALFSAFLIYCHALRKVWRHRHQLKGLFNPLNEDPFAGTIITEIEIVSTSRPRLDSTDENSPIDTEAARKPSIPGPGKIQQETFDPYTVDIGVGSQAEMNHPTRPDLFRLGSLTRNAALSETHPDAWLYARVAFLYFCALLISRIPSSINRVVSLVRPDDFNWGLNYTETLVFPSQGFWNAVVYVITSQTACRNLGRAMMRRPELPRRNGWVGEVDSNRSNLGGKGTKAKLGSFGKGDGDAKDVSGGGGVKRSFERLSSGKASRRWNGDDNSVSSLTAMHHR